MPNSVKQLLADANASVPRIAPEAARQLVREKDGLLVDVRDAAEVAATGKLEGALNVSRGMLEFRADPETPYHHAELRSDRPIILYCASGGRSALAARTLQQMGYSDVRNLGGFQAAVDAGHPVEPAEAS